MRVLFQDMTVLHGYCHADMQGTQGNPYRGVHLSKMTPGGPADRSGQLQIGDQILAVNGKNVEGHGYQRVSGCD